MNPRKSLKESTGRSRPSYPFDRATAEDKNIYLRYNNKKKRSSPSARWRSCSRWCGWSRATPGEVESCAVSGKLLGAEGPQLPRLGGEKSFMKDSK